MSRRKQGNGLPELGLERWLNERYAAAGGYARWLETGGNKGRPEEQAVIFNVTTATVYNWRKVPRIV